MKRYSPKSVWTSMCVRKLPRWCVLDQGTESLPDGPPCGENSYLRPKSSNFISHRPVVSWFQLHHFLLLTGCGKALVCSLHLCFWKKISSTPDTNRQVNQFSKENKCKRLHSYICSLASHSPTFTPRRLLVQCVNHGYSRIRGQVELGTEPSTLFIRLVYELLYLLTHSCQNNVIKRSLQQCRAVSVTFFFFTLFTFDK